MLREDPRSGTGLAIAALMISAWAGLLFLLLRARFSGATWLLLPLGTVAMTVLYAGLFVTAHDAVHGTVAVGRRRLNDGVGWVCTLAFALFDFRELARAHSEHHRAPASAEDPDFHASGRPGFFAWYGRFLLRYTRVAQVVGLALAFNVLNRLLGVPQVNLFAFWVAPPVLAATQLFYFGTYLPHREPRTGYRDAYRAESVRMPEIVSLLTCFHFAGFHREHHEQPHVPWWRLPGVTVSLRDHAG